MTGTPSHPSLDHIENPAPDITNPASTFPGGDDSFNWDSTPDYSPRKRLFERITRCVRPDGVSIVDVIADDGTAWTRREFGGVLDEWRQLPPLPNRED